MLLALEAYKRKHVHITVCISDNEPYIAMQHEDEENEHDASLVHHLAEMFGNVSKEEIDRLYQQFGYEGALDRLTGMMAYVSFGNTCASTCTQTLKLRHD